MSEQQVLILGGRMEALATNCVKVSPSTFIAKYGGVSYYNLLYEVLNFKKYYNLDESDVVIVFDLISDTAAIAELVEISTNIVLGRKYIEQPAEC